MDRLNGVMLEVNFHAVLDKHQLMLFEEKDGSFICWFDKQDGVRARFAEFHGMPFSLPVNESAKDKRARFNYLDKGGHITLQFED